ncbi:hypothetical protein E8E13_005699 [Curvularia kusanoi]|uniref:Pre-mRNA-splicing factor n=1 Tax=Curvularia kusanoi TaxID=90978 RepID=A0A9P4WAC3_CURKU|nr:hypothetical protein E8E13_005699 [Curvularia kusanoi]
MAAGGFKMSLGGLKAKPGLKAAANKNSAPKPKKALLGDDEPEDTNGLQEIAGFDAASGGAIDAHAPAEKKGPLVIPSLPNRNWRDEARKKQLERAPHTQQAQNGDVVMDEPEKEVVYGLTVPTAPTTDTPSNGAEETADQTAMDIDNAPQDGLTDAQRLEKQALESLLTGKSTDTARVVPAITDEEALANDLADAPDAPDVAAYEATPIEGFGLAMLRGMGWKDSDGEGGGRRKNNGGKAPAEVKRRPALLGIGAKEDAAKDVELGEFNSKARPKKGQRGTGEAPQGYNPVSLRNKKTGEIITEEELKRKMESQEMVQEEAARSERRSERSDRERSERDGRSSRDDRRDRRSDNDRRSDRDSHRDRDRDRRSSRDRGSRRDYDRRDDRRESDRRDSDRRDPDRRDNKRRHRSRSRTEYEKEDELWW